MLEWPDVLSLLEIQPGAGQREEKPFPKTQLVPFCSLMEYEPKARPLSQGRGNHGVNTVCLLGPGERREKSVVNYLPSKEITTAL